MRADSSGDIDEEPFLGGYHQFVDEHVARADPGRDKGEAAEPTVEHCDCDVEVALRGDIQKLR